VTTAGGSGAAAPEFREPAPQSHLAAGGLLDELSNVVTAARHTVSGAFELLTLEARRAGITLAFMIGLGLGAAILVVTAWLGLVAALVLWAISLGLGPIVAVLLATVLCLAGAGAAAYVCIRMSKDLLFPSSRRQIAVKVTNTAPQP
jgi:hypothetical protein